MTSVGENGLVRFRFYRPNVQEVSVVGDFNEWRRDALAMRPQDGGWWVADLLLNSGEYRFRYVADGQWYTDYASNGVENGKSGYTSVLVVPRTHTLASRRRKTVKQVA